MKITVSYMNIVKGIPGHSTKCPIVLACLDAGLTHISVGVQYISQISTNQPLKLMKLPSHVLKFINDFDSNFYVEPFEFELNVEGFN